MTIVPEETAPAPRGSFGLLRYFTLASLVAFAVVVVLLAVLSRRAALADLIRLEEAENIRFARSVANMMRDDCSFFFRSSDGLTAAALRRHPRVAAVTATLAEQLAGTGVLEVTLYGTAGRIVFSTDPAQIGGERADIRGFQTARAGNSASELTHEDTVSAIEGTVSDVVLVATFVPIRGADGEVEGVVELHSDVTALLAEIDRVRTRMVVGVSLILGLLYLALLLIVRHADIVIRNQARARAEAEAALIEARRDLERRVLERTGDLTQANQALAREVSGRRRLDVERERLVRSLEAAAEAAALLLRAVAPGEAVPGVLALMGRVAEASRCYWLGNLETVDGHPIPLLGTRWRAADQSDPVGWQRSLDDLPSLRQAVTAGGVVQVAAADLESSERVVLEQDGTRSLMLMPVHVHGRWVGCVGFDDCRRSRTWGGDVLTTLQSMVDGLALGVGRWVNERQRIELAAAVEQAAEGVMITDIDGRVRYVNAAYARMTGRRFDEMLGSFLHELDAAADAHAMHAEVLACLSRGEVWRGLREIRRPDGSVVDDQVVISPLTDHGGAVIGHLVLHSDVTEQQRLHQRLFFAQRMESVGLLAGGIAHDFNNMITVIMGATQLLRMRRELAADDDEDLAAIERAARSASELTRGLLAFARRQPLQREQLDVAAFVAGMRPMLRSLLPESIHLKLAGSSDLPMVLADRSQLEQVVVNLAINARDAMPLGGLITLSVDAVEVDQEFLAKKPWGSRGRFVCLEVRDTGVGMDEVTASRVFEPFFTTKEQGKGTGLGLATVYGVIKQHGGMIDVDSVKGAGTTFTVWLPAVTAASAAAVVEERAEQVGGSETLLVVEDQEDLRNLVVRYLVSLGYEVLEARDGGEGLRRLEQYGDAIALVFTDLVMPTLNGREMYERGRGFAPQAAFVFSSGYHDAAVREGLVDRPGVSFVAKPFQIESLAATIRTQLQGPLRSVAGC